MIFEGSRYRGGFMYKTLAMSAIVSFFLIISLIPVISKYQAILFNTEVHFSYLTLTYYMSFLSLPFSVFGVA